MDFVKEFTIFLFENKILRFGDFTLASGKKSPYYIDLRLVASYPHQFRKMIKNLQNLISDELGLDSFESIVSVPTGGLVIASALAIETVKPLMYVRNKPKDYGTTKSIEGKFSEGMKVVMIDDVATTGGSVINAIKILKEENIIIKDAYVIVNRSEGAEQALKEQGVKIHQIADMREMTEILHKEGKISDDILQQVKDRINQDQAS